MSKSIPFLCEGSSLLVQLESLQVIESESLSANERELTRARESGVWRRASTEIWTTDSKAVPRMERVRFQDGGRIRQNNETDRKMRREGQEGGPGAPRAACAWIGTREGEGCVPLTGRPRRCASACVRMRRELLGPPELRGGFMRGFRRCGSSALISELPSPTISSTTPTTTSEVRSRVPTNSI